MFTELAVYIPKFASEILVIILLVFKKRRYLGVQRRFLDPTGAHELK